MSRPSRSYRIGRRGSALFCRCCMQRQPNMIGLHRNDLSLESGVMTSAFITHLSSELDGLKAAGLYKSERVITSKQAGEIEVASRRRGC